MANFPPRAPSGNQPASQPSDQPGSGYPAAGGVPSGSGVVAPTGVVGGMRTAGVRSCPGCSTPVNVHATVCPNCGEQIATKEKTIRCRRCRHRASSNLVVCPHCGRELQPATSRWLTWGLPLLAVLLLSGFLVLRAGRGDPSSWAQAQVDRIVRLVQSLGSRLQPDVTISMIPAGQDPNDPLVSQAAQAGVDLNAVSGNQAEVVDVASTSVDNALVQAGETAAGVPQEEAGSAPPADTAAATPTAVAAVEPAEPAIATSVQQTPPAQQTATLAQQTATSAPPTATAEPTAEASATATATQEPTSTATGTAIATQAPTQAATAGASVAATRTLTRTTAAAAITNTSISTRTAAAGTPAPVLTQTTSLLGLATSTPIPAQPAATPTSAATATPTPLAIYEVRRGDTLFEIASQYDVTVEDLLGANGLTEDDVYTIQPGDELKIPAPTPEGGSTESSTESNTEGGSATATPAPATYTVRAGDTVLAIALRNGVSMEDMLAANGMTINDARTLQPGDELVIPGAEGVATPVATASGTATATAISATAPSPTATPAPEGAVRVDAPRLRSPENGTAVSCGGQGTLTWLQVPSVRPADLYLVHLGYVNSIAGDGQEEVIWVISQQRPISATSWQLNNDLCGLAPNTAGKQWRWYVEVVESAADGLRPVSPASPVWGFTWQ